MTRWTHLLILSGCILLIPAARSQTFKTKAEILDRTRFAEPLDAAIHRDGSVTLSTKDSFNTPDALLRTSDGGRTWRRDASLPPPPEGRLFADLEDPETVYSCGPTLQRTTTGGQLWYTILNQYCFSFTVDSGNRNVLLFRNQKNEILRSVNFGNSWTKIDTAIPADKLISDRSGFGLIAATTEESGKLLLSRNRGATFDILEAPRGFLTDVSFLSYRPGAFYAVIDGAVHIRDETGAWFRRAFTPHAYTVLADPQFPGRVWAATRGGLYRSSDEGRNWDFLLSGDYYTIRRCGVLYASGNVGITWYSHDEGQTWAEFPRTGSLDFGAACSGYAHIYSTYESSDAVRRYLPSGELAWKLDRLGATRIRAIETGAPGRFALLANGLIRFFGADGKREDKAISAPWASEFEVADDESIALWGFRPQAVLTSIVQKFDAGGVLQFSQEGTLFAVRPRDQGVVIQETASGRYVVRTASSTETMTLPRLGRAAIRYLPNRDYIVAGVSFGTTYQVARYAADGTAPLWSTDLRGVGPGPVRLSLDDAENVYIEIGSEPTRTFACLDRNGVLQWSGEWPFRRFLLVDPKGGLSVLSTEGGGARLETVVDPKGKP